MTFLRNRSTLLAFSAATALALAIGCSKAEDGTESSSSDITTAQTLVISQVYGAGGNHLAPWQNDYVELFNASDVDVELAGKSIQYAAAAGNFSSSKNVLTLPATTAKLPAGHYFLIQLATGVTPPAVPEGQPLDHPDYIAAPGADGGTSPELISMSGSNGKVALVDTLLDGCGAAATQCDPTKYIDLVGYGTVTQFRTAPAAALGTDTAAIRLVGGCATAGDNSADFRALPPAPRNALTPPSPLCSGVDAAVPPPPPPSDASTDGATKKDSGAHTTKDAGPKPPKDAGPKKGTTSGDDDDDDDDLEAPGDGGISSKVTTHPTSGAVPAEEPVKTTPFPATAPDCTMSSGPIGSHTGLAAIFGIVFAAAAARRRRR